MCGIICITSKTEFTADELLASLKRLEYRGYDSFGMASSSGLFLKKPGEIRNAGKGMDKIKMRTGISHTRWATHGGITEYNSHPHADCSNSIFIVHNGILENYKEMKDALIKKGHKFKSETDSEVISHYLEEKLKIVDMESAIHGFFREAKGTFAVLILKKNENTIYAIKRDSPLVLGIIKDGFVAASDIYAFS